MLSAWFTIAVLSLRCWFYDLLSLNSSIETETKKVLSGPIVCKQLDVTVNVYLQRRKYVRLLSQRYLKSFHLGIKIEHYNIFARLFIDWKIIMEHSHDLDFYFKI